HEHSERHTCCCLHCNACTWSVRGNRIWLRGHCSTVGSKNANGQGRDPRGLLSVKGPELGLSAQEMAQLRRTVGDVVCPGTQGTAFLIGEGRDILTNAHIFVDENGKDRGNLDKCFWQNKDEPFQRISVETGEHDMKLFTRSTVKEFYLDLAGVR